MKDTDFCKRLKQLRENLGLTQQELDVAADLPIGVTAHYEAGTRAPGLASLRSIMRGLGCSPNDLLGDK